MIYPLAGDGHRQSRTAGLCACDTGQTAGAKHHAAVFEKASPRRHRLPPP
jgi:hypothetical protein